mmetsp:Transcript_18/g.53  ORF Transcript_18/g.53 Transcript_18/m.53 type:complete len:1061 (+) Transcript_18:87-3269(+)
MVRFCGSNNVFLFMIILSQLKSCFSLLDANKDEQEIPGIDKPAVEAGNGKQLESILRAFTFNLDRVKLLVPTNAPNSPSENPSMVPSPFPSLKLSKFPTLALSAHPSKIPTSPPSKSPQFAPSHKPSHPPFLAPSFEPSQSTSVTPSMKPTASKTHNPSKLPTAMPSSPPTRVPSFNPSEMPTTLEPTAMPTKVRSMSPSNLPSIVPTSHNPTPNPTPHPTDVPPFCEQEMEVMLFGMFGKRGMSFDMKLWKQLTENFLLTFFSVKRRRLPPKAVELNISYIEKFDALIKLRFQVIVHFPHSPLCELSKTKCDDIFLKGLGSSPGKDVYIYQLKRNGGENFENIYGAQGKLLNSNAIILPTVAPTGCPTIEPTADPSFVPSFNPTSYPTSICHDTASWINELDMTCDDFRLLGCADLDEKFFSRNSETNDVLINCQESCGYCVTKSPSGKPSILSSFSPSVPPTDGPTLFVSIIPTGLPSRYPIKIESEIPSSAPSFTPTNFPSETPSFAPSPLCFDKPHFRTKVGLICESHSGVQCGSLISIGLQKFEVWEIMKNCPKSCGYCETSSPSTYPSQLPSFLLTKNPSMHPSYELSKLPTVMSSTHPSDLPSFKPSSSPSLSPASFPSVIPSGSPSWISSMPSSVPSNVCHDNRFFVDKKGRSCSMYKGIQCEYMTNLGYSKKEVKELLWECRQTCNQCQTKPSSIPSSIPSSVPSLSMAPTFIPLVNIKWLMLSIISKSIPTAVQRMILGFSVQKHILVMLQNDARLGAKPASVRISFNLDSSVSNANKVSIMEFSMNIDVRFPANSNINGIEKKSRAIILNAFNDPASGEIFIKSLLWERNPFNVISIRVIDIHGRSLPPSSIPSQIHSSKPTYLPSSFPSHIPSLSPSTFPSDLPSSSPSDIPSVLPSAFPSYLPSYPPSASPSTDCTDDPAYLSPFGIKCPGYMGWECFRMTYVGFTPSEQDTLIISCPLSCGSCGEVTQHPTHTALMYQPTLSPTSFPIGIPLIPCVDDITYINQYFQTCDAYKGIICSALTLLGGFTLLDVEKLVTKCPKTCNLCR